MKPNGNEFFNLFCGYGTLDSIVEFGQSLSTSDSSCKNDGASLTFLPKNCSYNDGLPKNVTDELDRTFSEQCGGQANCTFALNMTLIPPSCQEGLDPNQLVYFMQVGCKSDTVSLFGAANMSISKGTVAFVVVFSDVFASICLILFFFFLKSMQTVTAQEIDDSEITAKDFCVEIRGLPPHENVREFKAALWQWVETINEKSPAMKNPETNTNDENQNNLMNITFGMSDYGKMNFMMTMADLFHEKKKLEKLNKLDEKNIPRNVSEIDRINKQGQFILRDLERYVKISRSKAVVAFAQFQSMTAKQKFYKNAHTTWFQRTFQAKKVNKLK